MREISRVVSLSVAIALLGAGSSFAAEPLSRSLSLEQLVKAPGNGNRLVLVDGAKSSQERVKEIPSSAIERVELLPKDAALVEKFGADAANGAVNVVTRKP